MWWRKQLDQSQSIFALASGSLPCAVAIVRLSGQNAFTIASQLLLNSDLPTAGRVLGNLFDSKKEKIDQALVLTFTAPHSFTGENVIEFHIHGSPIIFSKLQRALLENGARPAEAGEFSYRAFLNGKLSLVDLEALGDLYQVKQASDLKALYDRREGSLQKLIDGFRNDLLGLQAVLDTAIDFSEEYSSVLSTAKSCLEKVIHGCSLTIQRFRTFRSELHFPRLVLAGRPNAGKSSLFNALLGRQRALVHAYPGTTRDVVEEELEFSGQVWKLADTAGVRTAESSTEAEGIEMGSQYLSACNMWVLVVDSLVGIQESEYALLERFGNKPHCVVWNKADLITEGKTAAETVHVPQFSVSCVTGEGIPALWEGLASLAEAQAVKPVPLPSASQAARLERVLVDLRELESLLNAGAVPEILGEKSRLVMGQLESVIGEVDTEEVLGRVFSDFCIGK